MSTKKFAEFLSEVATEMERKSQDTFTISFSEIARTSALPRSAFKHRAWWANHGSKAWLKAGLRTEAVDMERQQVTFRRSRPSIARSVTQDAQHKDVHTDFHEDSGRFRFGAEPAHHDGPHPFVGVLRGKIRIAPDFDLTTPADPDWGRVYDK